MEQDRRIMTGRLVSKTSPSARAGCPEIGATQTREAEARQWSNDAGRPLGYGSHGNRRHQITLHTTTPPSPTRQNGGGEQREKRQEEKGKEHIDSLITSALTSDALGGSVLSTFSAPGIFVPPHSLFFPVSDYRLTDGVVRCYHLGQRTHETRRNCSSSIRTKRTKELL
ncbi:hypothetical protein P170DRAFT_143829 [Aspergillus steynii IBT 23096]|uniref:Uncharacterized protein n=1 Tax=Aspergillus steynii IBT 23096 TaxID=1392250 RepID=A0A2I2GC24_9EURO|nr:uncharacterized protein P170DRAFT_143829 [Aspergillus steynii IBT 23096]PLB50433.1 hypothetical protein P170DRAFT_143829 [Aspergillus steynii IBT 23096]